MKSSPHSCYLENRRGFTLVEILVAMAVLALIMAMLLTITVQISDMWRKTSGKLEQFRDARDAFDSMSRRISQATLNTYWDYDDPAAPTRYVRQSELRFISGPTESIAGAPGSPKRWPTHGIFFQAPFGFVDQSQTVAAGLENLLNTWGYFVEFGDDNAQRPSIFGTQLVPPRYRYRLMELMQPANALTLYGYTSGMDGATSRPRNLSYTGISWFADSMKMPDTSRPTHILAENVVALILLPKLPQAEDTTGIRLAPTYTYDSTVAKADATINSKNQLPPLIQVTLVAIDETSAKRLERGTTMPDFGEDGLFADAAKYDSDLNTLQQTLTNKHVSFRVFTTNVPIKGAKWSRAQQN